MANVNLTPRISESYHQVGVSYSGGLVTYTNDSGVSKQINSITMYMGTGNGDFTDGTPVYNANGSAITVSFTCNGVTSSSQSVTNIVTPISSPSYPDRSQMQAYTFTFSGCIVPNGSTVSFEVNTTTSSSGTVCFVWDRGHRASLGDGHYAIADITDVSATCNITYNGNGAKIYSPITHTSEDTITDTATTGQTYTVPNYSGTKPDPYVFLGWSENASATSATYVAGSTFTPTGDKTLYAIYSSPSGTFTVRFLDGYSSPEVVLSSQSVAYGNSATPPTTPTRSGYVFVGWDRSYQGIIADTDIHAMWSQSGTPVWIYTQSGWIPYKPSDS